MQLNTTVGFYKPKNQIISWVPQWFIEATSSISPTNYFTFDYLKILLRSFHQKSRFKHQSSFKNWIYTTGRYSSIIMPDEMEHGILGSSILHREVSDIWAYFRVVFSLKLWQNEPEINRSSIGSFVRNETQLPAWQSLYGE